MLSAYKGKEPYIFISYSHKDAKVVLPILEGMQNQGYRIWFDGGIEAGAEWSDNIAARIENCTAFLAFTSNRSMKSKNCIDEVFYAYDCDRPSWMVYLHEDVTVPRGLKMRTSRFQNMYYWRQPNLAAFLRDLGETSILEDCREKLPVSDRNDEPIAAENKEIPVKTKTPKTEALARIFQIKERSKKKTDHKTGAQQKQLASGSLPWWIYGLNELLVCILMAIIYLADTTVYPLFPISAVVNSILHICFANRMHTSQIDKSVRLRNIVFGVHSICTLCQLLWSGWEYVQQHEYLSFNPFGVRECILYVLLAVAWVIYFVGDAVAQKRWNLPKKPLFKTFEEKTGYKTGEQQEQEVSGKFPWWLCGMIEWTSFVPWIVITPIFVGGSYWYYKLVMNPIIAAINSIIYICLVDKLHDSQIYKMKQYRNLAFWINAIFAIVMTFLTEWESIIRYRYFWDEVLGTAGLTILARVIYFAGDAVAQCIRLKRGAVLPNVRQAGDQAASASIDSKIEILLVSVCTALEIILSTLVVVHSASAYQFIRYSVIVAAFNSCAYIVLSDKLSLHKASEFERIRNIGFSIGKIGFVVCMVAEFIRYHIVVVDVMHWLLNSILPASLFPFLVYYFCDHVARKRIQGN